MIDELKTIHPVVFTKSAALIKLCELKENSTGFIKELLKHAETFAPEHDEHKPKLDTTELQKYIDTAHRLFNAIVKAYNEQGKPRWMWNILRHILSEERLAQMDFIG
jgi:hypothetical protein